MKDSDILSRLDAIEHQLAFFANSYKHLHNIFIQGVHVKLEKELLEPKLSKISEQVWEFQKLYERLSEVIKKDCVTGTLAFMAKRLHEIEAVLSKLDDTGIKKKIHLDLTLDGYEMVKKKGRKTTLSEDIENPEDATKKLLETLDKRYAEVLIHRYGLFNEKAKTCAETGKIMGVSGNRIAQIESKVLRLCRHPTRRTLAEALTHKELRKDILGE